ncbi:hypothetical protein M2168_003603 [Streptomyces sp. CZ24]|nr:hypothetical protein [Streptomyces sp. CZ24]
MTRPSTAAKVVRSASCRATTRATARSSAATSSAPVSRSASPELYAVPPGLYSSRNHSRRCANEAGSSPVRSAGRMACGSATTACPDIRARSSAWRSVGSALIRLSRDEGVVILVSPCEAWTSWGGKRGTGCPD